MRGLLAFLAIFIFAANASYAAFDSADLPKSGPLEITRITPDGSDVPAGKQIVITFNRPVVPIGRMERTKEEIPVTISPALECEWRWLNTTALACILSDKAAMAQSTAYAVTVNPGIKAEDGETIAETFKHSFITDRADVRYAWFRTWKSPSYPVIRLTFNQSVTKKSVEQSLFFRDDKGAETGLTASIDPDDRHVPSFIRLPSGKGFIEMPQEEGIKSDDQPRKADDDEARRIWLVEPKDELGIDNHASLQLKPGLVSAEGPERSVVEREVVGFDTYPEFYVVGVTCRTNDDMTVLIKPGEKSDQLCNPMAPVSLSFSVPVFRSQVAKNFEFTPAIPIEAWGDLTDEYSRLASPHQKERTYDVNLPYGLKAAQEYTVKIKARELGFFAGIWSWVKSLFTDMPETSLESEFYEKLKKPVTITFKTNHRKPNFELVHHDAVLEKASDGEVPLYVNNLEKMTFNYRKVTKDGVSEEEGSTDLPKIEDLQYAVPFGVRQFLGGKSGAVFGHLSTTPYVDKGWKGAYRLFAQVTPYQVHVKLGHYSSLVWVTDMADGNVVKDANVTFYRDALSTLGLPENVLSTGKTDENGIARLVGTEKIDPDLELSRGWDDEREKIFVRVEKGEDIAVVPLNSAFDINIWRVSNQNIHSANRKKYGHIITWGTTAQGIYRTGDTIQYKFYVRNQNDNTLTTAPREGYTLEIVDPMDNSVEKVESLKLNEFGAYNGDFKVAKEAPVGWYRFRLTAKFAPQEDGEEESSLMKWEPLKVLVSDFTPVPFRVENSLNGDLFRGGQEVEVQTDAKMHAGGPYTDASARITAIINAGSFTSKHPVAADFLFSTSDQQRSSQQVFQKIEGVNEQGELTTTFTLPETGIYYGRLSVESAVQDDRGKYVASMSQADYVDRDRFVGLKSPQWVYEAKKPATINYIVVDEKGAPVKGSEVVIDIEREVTSAARVKGAGNAYITNFTTEWKKESECKGVSEETVLDCIFTPEGSGSYRAVAKVIDTKGRSHSTTMGLWMTGRDYVLWNNESDVLLPIIPEKMEYHVGDTARYLVKNPYPGAKALIAIERYGVIDSFVQTLEGSTPVIEFPVKPDYLPGFYLSVMVVSPRVDKPVDENQVDLGKPTFRMGYVTVPVKDKYKEMLVEAKTAQEVYRPRDKVTVKLHAAPRMPGKQEPVEIAVAVLDEAVFDLVQGGTMNFDPYEGFYALEGLDLRNYNLLTRLIGRQKFEKKGANQGGDGGSDLNIRDLFKFVAYWNPALKTDAKGNAEISFEVPDNLTGWRVLALAVTPTDRLGLGQGNFKVNRPTEVRPVMPNQVTERDFFKAGFSVMNRTDKPRTLDVVIKASGPIDVSKTPDTYKETVTLEPYKRATVFMPLQTSALPELRDVESELTFDVRAKDRVDGDGMVHKTPVHKMRSLETAANYGTTTQAKVSESIAFPSDIYPDVGAVSVVLAPSVIGNVEGAFKYIRDYPHLCWEQILTKGVMASHFKNLKGYMPEGFVWKGSESLPQGALDSASAFQAPNGGMTYFYANDEYADPYLSAYTALAFNWLKSSAYKIPERVETRLHDYLLNFLRNDTAPSFYSEGMSSTIRAVALAALAPHGKITGDDIDRFRTHVPQMSLFGKTHFMQAAMKVSGKAGVVEEVAKLILSHANQTGGKFIFNEELDDSYYRILASPLRENCAILDTFTAFGETKEGVKLVSDVPFKLVRTITQTRGNRDHWENTQENIFCMNALVEYSRVYEREKPDMEVEASMDGNPFGEAEFEDLRDKPVTLERKIEPADVGRKATVEIEKDGDGRLYYATRLQYAPRADKSKPTNAGIEITREMSVERDGKWELLEREGDIRRGDIVRVDLYLSVPAARNFVAVSDPVPGGLEPVNRDLANTSTVDADKGAFKAAGGSWFFKFSDWISFHTSRWSFYHKELRHDSARFYADYLPAGNYHLSYTAQAIAEGKFTVMPTHAEEMYDPDVYGKGVSGELSVGE